MLIYSLPIIAAFTGWLTNFIAVKMLFHPKEKVKVLFFSIQGIFPKRKQKLAEKLGKVVSNELFSINDIKEQLNSPENMEKTGEIIEERIDVFLNEKIAQEMPMLGMFLNNGIKTQIKNTLTTEFKSAIPDIIGKYSERIEQAVNVEKIVYEKVANFSSDKLEEMLYSIMKKEFRFIEILGGILGFFIGIIQVLIVKFGNV